MTSQTQITARIEKDGVDRMWLIVWNEEGRELRRIILASDYEAKVVRDAIDSYLKEKEA